MKKFYKYSSNTKFQFVPWVEIVYGTSSSKLSKKIHLKINSNILDSVKENRDPQD